MRIQPAARAPYFSKNSPVSPQFGKNPEPIRLDLNTVPIWDGELPKGAIPATIIPGPDSTNHHSRNPFRALLLALGLASAATLPTGCYINPDNPIAVSGSYNGASGAYANGNGGNGSASASSSAGGNSSSASTSAGGSSASASSGFYAPPLPPQHIYVAPPPQYIYVAPPPQCPPRYEWQYFRQFQGYDHCGRPVFTVYRQLVQVH